MLTNSQNFLFPIILSFIFVSFAFAKNLPPPLSVLVPRIDQENFQLEPKGQSYNLRIQYASGGSRDETTELQNPSTPDEALYTQGTISIVYPEKQIVLVITYEAGKNGYVVKYSYRPFVIGFLSPNALKSATG